MNHFLTSATLGSEIIRPLTFLKVFCSGNACRGITLAGKIIIIIKKQNLSILGWMAQNAFSTTQLKLATDDWQNNLEVNK